MIRSVSPRMAKRVNELIAHSAHWENVLRRYVTKMRTGFWEQAYLDCMFQLARGNWDIYAAYCFAHLHAWISIGKIVMAAIDLGLEPREDSAIAENDGLLTSLPPPFSGKFWGSNDTCDGYVKWSEPIEFGQIDCTGREIVSLISPRSVPLEVGSTNPDTTIYHILGEGGLARWPYGSKRIHLLIRNPQFPRVHTMGI